MTILYYVYDKKGNKPTYLHNTYKNALEEAKRVAKITQNKIEILAVVAHVEPMTDFKITTCGENKGDKKVEMVSGNDR